MLPISAGVRAYAGVAAEDAPQTSWVGAHSRRTPADRSHSRQLREVVAVAAAETLLPGNGASNRTHSGKAHDE